MPKNYQGLKKKLKFDPLMRLLDSQFQAFPDHRADNTRYKLADVLKSGFAMFSLKSPSLLAFKPQSVAEQSNLHSIYRIEGDIPCDNQMRGILDPCDPQLLRPIFPLVFQLLRQAGVIKDYQYWYNYVIVSVDGVEHFSSTKVHCPSCTTRTHRDGEISYHHSGLAAVVVHPNQSEVFPLDFEPILRQDGAKKNDCERNAAKRLCEQLRERYAEMPILLVEDALYANAPHLRQIIDYGWLFIINVKPDSHESLFKQFAGRQSRGQVKELRYTDEKGIQHYYCWTTKLCLCDSATDVTVNFLLYEQTNKDGKVLRWTWVTNLPLNTRSVEKVMRAGRSRWKIENETFNTLKNQGYHFEHNYGHGQQHLATILALLMMLAFLVDQIQQHCCPVFRQLWQGLGTKSKLWFSLRSLFHSLLFKSMATLYQHMAALNRLQLE
jgi:hypothetical protein